MLLRLSRSDEADRLIPTLGSTLGLTADSLLDAYVPLLELGLVTFVQVQLPGPQRRFQARLDVTPKGARYLRREAVKRRSGVFRL